MCGTLLVCGVIGDIGWLLCLMSSVWLWIVSVALLSVGVRIMLRIGVLRLIRVMPMANLLPCPMNLCALLSGLISYS